MQCELEFSRLRNVWWTPALYRGLTTALRKLLIVRNTWIRDVDVPHEITEDAANGTAVLGTQFSILFQ